MGGRPAPRRVVKAADDIAFEERPAARTWLAALHPTGPLVWVGVLVTVAFGYFAVRDVRLSDTWAALRTSQYVWLIPALAALAVALFLRAVRWRALFAYETRPRLGAVSRALVLGYFFNSVLPLRAGEAARVIAVKQAAGTSRAETAATVVTERVYDIVSLVALLLFSLFWLPELSWLAGAVLLGIALAAGLAVAVLLLRFRRRQLMALGLSLVRRLPLVSEAVGERALRSLGRGLAGLTHGRTAAVALAWTVASWAALALSSWLVTLCLDLDVPPIAGLLVVIATSLSLVLPSSPGAIGVFEAAAVIALDAYGVPRAEALSYALVLHALNFFPFLLAGAIVLAPGVGGLRREAAGA